MVTEILMAHQLATAVPVEQRRPDVPVELAEVVRQMMAKRPELRYETPTEVAEALAPWAAMPGNQNVTLAKPPARKTAATTEAETIGLGPRRQPDAPAKERRQPSLARRVSIGIAALLLVPLAWLLLGGRLGTDGSRPTTVSPPIVEASSIEPPPLDDTNAAEVQRLWVKKLKVPVETTSKLGIKMMLIPPGPLVDHPITIGKYKVTQKEWQLVMGTNPSSFKAGNDKVVGLDTKNFPVEQVSWFDSVEFCNKLSAREGLKPYYDLKVLKRPGTAIEEAEVKIVGGNGYHIPTDPEWEQACRAGTVTKYYCGDKDDDLLDHAWFDKNSGGRTHAVGEKKPNGFGLYDMHGNVREWNEEMLTNAMTGAPERVNRGGNWISTAGPCAVSARSRHGPASRHNSLGVRLARVPVGAVSLTHPPPDDAWLKTVAAMPPEKQVEAVAAKLKERNPGFPNYAGKIFEEKIEDGVVTQLRFQSTKVTDISPLRALTGLRSLSCYAVGNQGPLADLSPLKDLKLNALHCGNTKVSDLSLLKDMKLTNLDCSGTNVSDLSPLKEMKLTYLNCGGTKVTDLSPLKGMPLKSIFCDFKPERDTEILRSIKTLEWINGKPVAEFWKEVDAKKP
jgi:formylglycine-generating enzyme required for sulfatase activity